MEGHTRTPAAASVAAVLGDGDLLREILIRLGFPNYLVRAAIVCKRWLLHASDPAFLRRFHDRHPPRLLGFCVGHPHHSYKFVPLPQPPELAALSRRVASFCDDAFARSRGQWITHCRNGRLVTEIFVRGTFRYSLLAPLLAEESVLVPPPAPLLYNNRSCLNRMFLPRDGGRDGITLVNVKLANARRQVRATVYVLGSGGLGVPTTVRKSVPQDLPPGLKDVLPPIHGKIFIVTTLGYTLVLDLATARFSTFELPGGVGSNFMLSCVEDSDLYLVSTKGFQLSVWLHRMTRDSLGVGGWLLVDTFCVLEACTRVAGDSWVRQNDDLVDVVAIGDNAQFVFLDHLASGVVFIVHLRSKVVQKVYQRVHRIGILPVMMIWPPVFPARNIGHDQEE
jgi:hypothetical protein